MPTLCVLVIAIGPSRNPLSRSTVVPFISPLPFSVNHAPKTGSLLLLPRGCTIVTPVRTGPSPTFSRPSPDTSVVCPTSMPDTSVIASSAPGVPPMIALNPRSRARGFGDRAGCATAAMLTPMTIAVTIHARMAPPLTIRVERLSLDRVDRHAPADRKEQTALAPECPHPPKLREPTLDSPVVGRARKEIIAFLAQHRARIGPQVADAVLGE